MWARISSIILGIWLMAAPAVLGYGEPARANDRIVGPLAAAFAVIAVWEVTRPLRWVDLVLGLWLLVAPWVLGYRELDAYLNSLAVGTCVALLAPVQGKITQHLGGGWSALWKSDGLSQERQQVDDPS